MQSERAIVNGLAQKRAAADQRKLRQGRKGKHVRKISSLGVLNSTITIEIVMIVSLDPAVYRSARCDL
ncbi:MAG: hypothetical protein ACLTTJ_14325 [Blautia sp.]